ncbi:MAG: UDP-N-acetylmuramoyl-tripeptide--D-alanyl-D-alanine ligase [Rickettsiales bacterium]|jgi:UDP-N-acetylmuramoyl-tripeptide--D-alanyl-D-alanine ligase|nr:UDP-N-acetylmuramoyl-tripeptide--D-alanyl-D-alanine ligase [Rickettsiales bacterium]
MLYDIKDLENALKDDLVYIDENYDFSIDNVVFDNREVQGNSMFISRKGEKNDGHRFIADTLKNNKSAVVLAEYLPKDVKQDPRIILVKNTMKAFENLAIFSRRRLQGHVIGITGSVGKTSTKDSMFYCLSDFGKSFCNIHSFNNHIGVLTTLVNTPKDTEFAIYEMGMNTYGEMDVLRELVKPEIAVILNVKSAHIGNFKSEEEIAIEKSKITDNSTKITILNLDSRWFKLLRKKVGSISTFGTNGTADVILSKHIVDGNIAEVEYVANGKTYVCKLNNLDHNIAYNAMAIVAVAKYLGLDIDRILQKLTTFDTSRGRNNIEYANYDFNGKNVNLTIINGSYNAANPETFVTGLKLMDNIYKQNKNRRKVCIFGDILEAGEKSVEFHLSLKQHILDSNIQLLITTGDYMKMLSESLDGHDLQLLHVSDITLLTDSIKNYLEDKDLVFIKSSKGIGTYKVLNQLVGEEMKVFT